MRLRKRGDTWHAEFYELAPDGTRVRVRRSTGCTDKAAADARGRQLERDAADPDHARTRGATLNDACALLLGARREQARAGRKADATVRFYESKCGQLLRVLGHDLALARLDAAKVDAYISARRAEWADDRRTRHVTDHTISKEIVALRAALKLARRAGIWKGDPAAVCPIAFAPEYKPRERALPLDQLHLVLAALREQPDHAARVAFIYATSAEWSASERAERADVRRDARGVPIEVLVRGTKRETRWRVVPLVSEVQRSLVKFALDHAEGRDGKLFAPWGNVGHGLRTAAARTGCLRTGCARKVGCTRSECVAARIAPFTPNDLRRSTAHQLKLAGAPNELVAPVMGHKDTRMLERVYGRLNATDLAARLAATMGLAAVPAAVTPVYQTTRTEPDSSDASDAPVAAKAAENTGSLVPRDGIEPPTRGFSVPAPIWPRPQKKQGGRAKRGATVPRVSQRNGGRRG